MKRTALLRVAIILTAIGGGAANCIAQMPATPVLQNAWANAGITIAADYGKASDASAFAEPRFGTGRVIQPSHDRDRGARPWWSSP